MVHTSVNDICPISLVAIWLSSNSANGNSGCMDKEAIWNHNHIPSEPLSIWHCPLHQSAFSKPWVYIWWGVGLIVSPYYGVITDFTTFSCNVLEWTYDCLAIITLMTTNCQALWHKYPSHYFHWCLISSAVYPQNLCYMWTKEDYSLHCISHDSYKIWEWHLGESFSIYPGESVIDDICDFDLNSWPPWKKECQPWELNFKHLQGVDMWMTLSMKSEFQ